MERLYKEFGGKIEFIGISQDDSGKIEDFVKKLELSFPIARDAEKNIAPAFDARIPTHILVDVHGTIRYSGPSPPEVKDLENILK